MMIERISLVVERRRAHLPFPPADVVLSCGQDNGSVRTRPIEVFVAPVSGKIARDTRMIDLQRQNDSSVIVRISHHGFFLLPSKRSFTATVASPRAPVNRVSGAGRAQQFPRRWAN